MATNPIRAAAEKLEPGLRRAFLEAIQGLASAETAALVEAINLGDVNRVLELLGLADDALVTSAMTAALNEVVMAGAQAAPISISGRRVQFAFDVVNPRTVDAIQQYRLNLIRQINDTTREAIRHSLRQGLEAGINPRTIARDIQQTIGLTTRQTQAVANFRSELERIHRGAPSSWGVGQASDISRAPGGAQVYPVDANGNLVATDPVRARRLRDFRYDRTLARAGRTGVPLTQKQIDTMVDAYARKYRRHRAETIARTEALRAAHLGQFEQYRQAADAGLFPADLVRRRWVTAGDERVRASHRPIPRLNPGAEGFGIGMGDLFVTPEGPVAMPPHGPNCRCTVIHRVIEPEMVGKPLGPLAPN